jgi:outer membrane protein assembly factor BamB
MRSWFHGLCGGLLTFSAVLSTTAEDWPRFLGPRADGTSLEKGLLNSLPTNGPTVLWDKTIGTGYSAPSVRGKTLVLHHRLGDEEIVEAMTADSGKSLWKFSSPTSYIDPYGYNNGPRCTPLLTSNRCYTFGVEGKLACLDLSTGKVIWQRETGKEFRIAPAFFGVGSTPVLEDNLLLVMVGGQPNSGMVAFDADTGKTVWERVGEKNWQGQPMIGWPGERKVAWRDYDKQASYATPVVATVHGERLVFCLMRQGLVVLEPRTGNVKFSFWFRSQLEDSVNAMCPIVIDDMVLISAAYYKVGSVLLKIGQDNKSFEEVWRGLALEVHWNTPIYENGYLYAFTGRNEPDAHFRCVEYKTGKVMWDRDESWRHGSRLDTPPVYGRGSAISAEGKLIVLGEGGLLGLFKLNPEKAEEISRYQMPQLHYPCWAAPVLSEKRLYLRSENKLVCVDFARK